MLTPPKNRDIIPTHTKHKKPQQSRNKHRISLMLTPPKNRDIIPTHSKHKKPQQKLDTPPIYFLL